MFKKLRIILLLITLSVTLSLMSNTYSRYVADSTNNFEVEFAKWQLLVNKTDITDGTNSSITFEPTIVDNTNVKENTIAPSTKGYFDVEIDPTNVDVSFSYEIKLKIDNTNIPDLMINKYAIIDSTYVEGQNLTLININNDGTITNTVNYDNTTFEKFTVRIYFEWIEGTGATMNDEADTQVGIKAAKENTKFKIDADIKFEQVI